MKTRFLLLGLYQIIYLQYIWLPIKNTHKYKTVIIYSHFLENLIFQIYEKVKSDSYIDSIRSKIFDNFTSSDPKYYGADFDMPDDHGTANMATIDPMGNVVVCTNTINTQWV